MHGFLNSYHLLKGKNLKRDVSRGGGGGGGGGGGEHEALQENPPKLQQGLEMDEKQSISFFL